MFDGGEQGRLHPPIATSSRPSPLKSASVGDVIT